MITHKLLSKFKLYLGYTNRKSIYFNNLIKRYISVYKKIKVEKDLLNISVRSYSMLPTVIDKEIYGYCHTCTPINDQVNFTYGNIRITFDKNLCNYFI